MTRRRALSLLFILFLPAACSQFTTVPAQTRGPRCFATLPAAAHVLVLTSTLPRFGMPPREFSRPEAPAAEDLAYPNYNIQVLVRAVGMAIMFYDSIDTTKDLPSNLRSLAPTLAAADKLRREDNDDEAIKTYRSITGGDIDMPRLARSYFGQALIFAKIPEQRKKATQLLRQAVYYMPDNSDASLALAMNYCFQQEWDNAMMAARRAVLLQPNDATARYWLGWIYFHGLQNNADAMAHLQEALRLKPNDEHALQELGVVSVYRGQYANAVTLLQRVIRLKANNAEAYWFLGIAYLKMDDRPQAQQVYRTLQRINKDLAREFAARM